MPAFSAIGAYVAGTLLGLTGTAATIAGVGLSWAGVAVASVAAIGASYITSRIINGNPNSGSLGSSNEGGRIQIPPASNNKIPVVYGSAYVNGMITDARLITTDKSKNDVMYYCIVLSEAINTSATYTIDSGTFSGGGRNSEIYWNDQRLIFDATSGNEHKVIKGVKTVDATDDTVDTNFQDLVEMRVYAGDGASSHQIWPPVGVGTPVNAWDYWAHDTNGSAFWNSSTRMEGLVFAIVRLKYNADKGFTNLAPVTFKLNNSVYNPAAVLQDYMTSDRYGAGLATSALNTTEFTKWSNYCAEKIRYIDKSGTSTTQNRASINGVIDTSRSVKENIDSILLNGNAWMSFDVAAGTWRPIIQKAISAGDPADNTTHFTGAITGNTTLTVTAFPSGRIEAGQVLYKSDGTQIGSIVSQTLPLTTGESTGQIGRYTISSTTNLTSQKFYTTTGNLLKFNDDNIISGISISSTRLDDLYNAYECEFFDRYNKDQKAYARDELADADRNPTEPDNTLRVGLDLTNNSIQANMISQIQLRQSRDDLVIEFTSSFYGIQTQAGDIIEVTNELYNWYPKLFRVIRVKEIEQEDGNLVANIQALEYNPDIYTTELLTDFTTQANIGIPPIYSGGADGNIQTPDDNLVTITANSDATASIPYLVLSATVPELGGPYDEIQVWSAIGPDPEQSGQPSERAYTLLQSHRPASPATIYENTTVVTATSITGGNTLNTASAHGLVAGDQLLFLGTTAGGLVTNTIYWVLSSGLTSTAFKVATSEAGDAVALTNATGLTINFNKTHAIYITGLPGNVAGQKYYFKTRMGLNNRYGSFTSPDASTLGNPTANWNPGGENSGFDLNGATEGDTIYYDENSSRWKKTSVLKINDTNNAVEINASTTESYAVVDSSNTTHPMAPLKLRHTTTGTPVAGFGTTLTFEAENAAHATKTIGYMDFVYDDITTGSEDAKMRVAVITAGVEPSYIAPGPQLELDSLGNLMITGDFNVKGSDITNTTGALNIQAATGSTTTITSNLANPVTIVRNSANTNAATRAVTLRGNSTGTPAVGFGVSADFEVETSANNFVRGGGIMVSSTDITAGAENFIMNFLVTNAGAETSKATLDNIGNFGIVGDLTVSGNDIKSSSATAITLSGANVTTAGDLTVSGNNIKSSTATAITLSGANVTTAGDLTVTGNLTVQGTTTTLNTQNVLIEDNIITLNSNVTGTPTSDSGIEVERGTSTNSSLTWDEYNGKWIQNRAGVPTTIPVNTGELAELTNLYFTNARARTAISTTNASGFGSLSYNSSTGVITYTGASAGDIRGNFSGGTGVSYDSSTGAISIGQAVSTTSNVQFNSIRVSSGVGSAGINWGSDKENFFSVTANYGATTVHSESGATFSGKKFIITIIGEVGSSPTVYKREVVEILLTHDYNPATGSTLNTYITEYGRIKSHTGNELGTFVGTAGGTGSGTAMLQFNPNRTDYSSASIYMRVKMISFV
jgi:hypothetical protein